jgi:hypothetical protein
MGIRYMAPTLGKWTQPDQALSQARLVGANPYAYANCNPTNNTDPTGAACAPPDWIGGTVSLTGGIYLFIVSWAAAIGGLIVGGLAIVGGAAILAYCAYLAYRS